MNKDVRLSWTAYLNREPVTEQELEDHEVVKCIERRASAFQGYVPVENMEQLQVVKFVPPGRFLADIALDTPTTVNSRIITIGLILKMIMSSNMGIDCRLSLSTWWRIVKAEKLFSPRFGNRRRLSGAER